MAKIKSGDQVVVITGKNKGATGKVLRVLGEKVVVELSGEEIKSDKGQYKKLILKEIN